MSCRTRAALRVLTTRMIFPLIEDSRLPPTFRTFPLLLLSTVFTFHLLPFVAPASAQTLSVVAPSDSLSEGQWSEETYYRIETLRLQRWVRENNDEIDNEIVLQELTQLLKEAKQFADAGDYKMANLWLETVWEMLKPYDISDMTTQTPIGLENGLYDVPLNSPPQFTWSRQVISGLDFWRQEFSFRFLESDSTFLQRNGNPYSGIRLTLDYGGQGHTRFNGFTSFKYSRDYLTAEVDFKFSGIFGKNTRWRLENRTEGTSFYRDFDLRYFQNRSTARLEHRLGPVTFEAQDDFMLRTYTNSDSAYPNYWNNSFMASSKFELTTGSLLTLGYRNVVRRHPDLPLNDYLENRAEVSLFQSVGQWFNLHIDDELRFRNYENVPKDHFFQDFWENYFTAEMQVGFTSGFGSQVNGGFTTREYQFISANSLPDFNNWEIEPQLYLKLGSNWKVAGGFHYEKETHQQFLGRVSDLAAESVLSIQFEDFYAAGPVVTIDFLNLNGLLFSLRESYLFRRYPNSRTSDVDAFNLYSDRNINSVLLFLTWNMTPRWQLNILANIDDDRSRKDSSGDSQNTLLGFELGYAF